LWYVWDEITVIISTLLNITSQLALFAGALVSLAQIMENVTNNNTSASWQALRVFLYGAIMLNLTGAFLSLVTIKMCSDLPLANYQKQFKSSLPTTSAAVAPTIPNGVKPWSRLGILLDAGMSPNYTFVDEASKWVLVASGVSTFASLTFWVFLNSNNWNTAVIITMVLFVPAALVVIRAFLIASRGEGWR
jgi:hypothetical protein